MILGITLTSLTFVALILTITAYYLYHRRQEDSMIRLARVGFYSSVGLIVVQVAMLLWGIVTHRFEWIYVFSYSSRDLPLHYLIATFWAGQEGTFLLWLLFGSIFGIVIIRSRKDDEPLVMSFMSMIQAFIVLILIKKNPFSYVWQINPQAFQAGGVPFDGSGLNPLLQDPWMTIHPPILFAGYSSTMILFSFAMAALVRQQYDNWIRSVYPFALFVGLTLGTGIILGGYWAYTTLGWGGYWAWDPVENSSLIPWLMSLALFHGIMVQRRQGGMKRTNLMLAIGSFFMVLYGSFLTRSGILTDFSVHSFSESTISPYLIGFMFLFGGIGLIAFLYRMPRFKGEHIDNGFFTRESFMAFGILLLLILAAFTFVGTSWPLFSQIFGDQADAVSIEAYNKFGGPIAILLGFMIAIAPVFSWKRESLDKLKSIALHSAVSVVLGGLAFIAGIRSVIPLLITVMAIFILLINGEIVLRMIRQKNYSFGGYLAHVGIGLMLIGIVTSSFYDSSTKITLPRDVNTSIMGYELRYGGKEDSPDGKDKVLITINNTDETYAKFYWSDYSQAYMVAPSVKNMLVQDLYISPIQIIPASDNSGPADEVNLNKGERQAFEDYYLLLDGYDMGSHEEQASGAMKIYARVKVFDAQGQELGEIRPGLGVQGRSRETYPDVMPGTQRKVHIKGVAVEQQQLILGISRSGVSNNPYEGKELLAVEVSIKPLINVLWLGTLVMIGGFIATIFNRTNRKKL